MEILINTIRNKPDLFVTAVCGIFAVIIAVATYDPSKPWKKWFPVLMVIIMVLLLVKIYFIVISNPPEQYELQPDNFKSIVASSTYNGDRATHFATNLIDGKMDTNWTEGVKGNGIGESILFTFNSSHTITGFRICSGNHASISYYTKNARPKKVKLTFDDRSSLEFTFLDIMEELSFDFSKAVTTKSIRLTIESVYEGSAYEDTVISEIAFLAEK